MYLEGEVFNVVDYFTHTYLLREGFEIQDPRLREDLQTYVFSNRFAEPTEPQRRAWPVIQEGDDVLIAAPTGSGKTFAAFLSAIDGLVKQGKIRSGSRVDPAERLLARRAVPPEVSAGDARLGRAKLGRLRESRLASG